MSVWIELLTLLCLTSTALCGPESSAVIWKNPGEDLTIQCRVTEAEYITLYKGLNEDVQIFYKADKSEKDNIGEEFKHRLQLNGQFPNMDFLIKNLSSADTGVYWCVYLSFDSKEMIRKRAKGNGSVLLVVRDEMTRAESDGAVQGCETRHLNLVLVCVVVSVSVLLCIVAALAWMFFKTKKLCSTVKPSTVSTNDVYEDMRGRLRS